jgi:hypothetical protein
MKTHLTAALAASLVVLTGCSSTPATQQELAQVDACVAAGCRPITRSNGSLRRCVSQKEDAHSKQLTLACVNSGGNPELHTYGENTGLFKECRRNKTYAPYAVDYNQLNRNMQSTLQQGGANVSNIIQSTQQGIGGGANK